jgi:ABC-type uncharacterized transport system substrate-binding protein
MTKTLLAMMIVLCSALRALGHPHIYVATGLVITIDDQGQIAQVQVTWAYDPLYSLMVLEDGGYDPDYDGRLTLAEQKRIAGWDMQWDAGFKGDLVVQDMHSGEVPLGPPTPISTELTEGKIITRHSRQPKGVIAAQNALILAYDPEFYTAYDMNLGVTLQGPGAPGCQAIVTPPIVDQAYREKAKQMAGFPEDAENVPLVGHVFADKVQITCRPPG